MDLILYFLQKLKVWDLKLTMHCDVLVLSVLIQRVFGGVRTKQNQGKFILGLRKNLSDILVRILNVNFVCSFFKCAESLESLPDAARTSELLFWRAQKEALHPGQSWTWRIQHPCTEPSLTTEEWKYIFVCLLHTYIFWNSISHCTWSLYVLHGGRGVAASGSTSHVLTCPRVTLTFRSETISKTNISRYC